jgi:hypothetical protein
MCAWVSLAALWLLGRPYFGIAHDARFYIGRAEANLDPAGVGQQLSFAHDGQSEFTIFTKIATFVVKYIGPGSATLFLTVLGLTLWFGAAAFLLRQFFRGRLIWSALAFVAILPAGYGAFSVFHWGEQFATPRVFAEAASLATLGLLVRGDLFASGVCLLLSAALHPIMSLPVGAIWLITAGTKDWRWFAAAGICGLGLVSAALLGAPVLGRLVKTFDPGWLDVVAGIQPFLFPSRWDQAAWASLFCQLGTIGLAASVYDVRFRRLLALVTVVGLAGLAISAMQSQLLIVQLQLWRSQWLLSFFAAPSLAVAAVQLWKRGDPSSRAALAMLAIAWVGHDSLEAVFVGIAFAGVLRWGVRIPHPFERTILGVGCLLALIFVVALVGTQVWALALVNRTRPPSDWEPIAALDRTGVQLPLIGAVAVAIGAGWLDLSSRWIRLALAGASMALVALVLIGWDSRTPFQKVEEKQVDLGVLRTLVPTGSVLWVGGESVSWLWTGRPDWWDSYEAAGSVFDRALAQEWKRRFEILVAAGIVKERDRFTTAEPVPPKLRTISGKAISSVCRSPSGPSWLIAPAHIVSADAFSLPHQEWRSPVPEYQYISFTSGWTAFDRFSIFNCAALAS